MTVLNKSNTTENGVGFYRTSGKSLPENSSPAHPQEMRKLDEAYEVVLRALEPIFRSNTRLPTRVPAPAPRAMANPPKRG